MPPRISRRGMATAPVRIGRRYFGIQTTWKAVWNTPFAVACTFSTGTVYHTRALSQGRAPPPRTEVRGFRRGHRSMNHRAHATLELPLREPGKPLCFPKLYPTADRPPWGSETLPRHSGRARAGLPRGLLEDAPQLVAGGREERRVPARPPETAVPLNAGPDPRHRDPGGRDGACRPVGVSRGDEQRPAPDQRQRIGAEGPADGLGLREDRHPVGLQVDPDAGGHGHLVDRPEDPALGDVVHGPRARRHGRPPLREHADLPSEGLGPRHDVGAQRPPQPL